MDPAYVATHVEEDRRHWWFRGRLAVLLAILRRVLPPGHARLLELGCGTGNVLAALAEFGEAVGMETHPDLAAAARAARLDVRARRLPDALVRPPGRADARRPVPGRSARDHGAGLSLALERPRCGARPPAALHRAWARPPGGARGLPRRPRELLQHAPLSRRRADARMEAAHGGGEPRPPPTLARGQPVARAGLRARASRRPACGATVRRLAAPRRPAGMRAPSWPGREGAQVGAILAALVALAAVWLALDRRPPEWDHANHLERAVICAQDLARGDLHAVLERSSFYPPLVLCAAGLVYRLAPSDVAAAQAVVLAFLALGVGAVYVLAHGLGGATEGVLAALLFATPPFVLFSPLHFQLDLPLASMVALILIVLLRIEAFGPRGWAVAAGIVLGLGMLTKPPFAVYVLAPLVLAAARIRSRRAVTNLILALFIGGALSQIGRAHG